MGALSTELWRLFISLAIPDVVKGRLSEIQESFRQALPTKNIRWTRPEQFHLTLRFLGAVEAEKRDALARALEVTAAGFPPFEIFAGGIGFFPNARRPRVLWVGVNDRAGVLMSLQAAIERATGKFSSEAAEKHFTGHLTLARLQALTPVEAESLARVSAGAPSGPLGTWEVRTVDLVRSELSPKGARHSVVASAPLLAPPIS